MSVSRKLCPCKETNAYANSLRISAEIFFCSRHHPPHFFLTHYHQILDTLFRDKIVGAQQLLKKLPPFDLLAEPKWWPRPCTQHCFVSR